MRIDELLQNRSRQPGPDEIFFRLDDNRLIRLATGEEITNYEFLQFQERNDCRVTTIKNLPDDPTNAPVPAFLRMDFKG